jgi:hypothetical protein
VSDNADEIFSSRIFPNARWLIVKHICAEMFLKNIKKYLLDEMDKIIKEIQTLFFADDINFAIQTFGKKVLWRN